MKEVQGGRSGRDVVIRELARGGADRFTMDLFTLLRQLRPDLSQQTFRELTSDGYEQGLRYLVAHSSHGKPVAAAGYRVLVTSRGRILFVDDLVTAEAERSHGIAAAMLSDLERRARMAGCVRLELDSGVTNTTAHRFYLRHRLDILAFHFGAAVDV